jgi:hypothetical protein
LGDPTNKVSNIGVPDWLQFISRGNLLQPNDNLFQAALVFEKEFQSMHGNGLSNERFIFRKLSEKTIAHLTNNTDLPYEVIACLSKTRTYIRLRELNRKISFENCRRKLNNKMAKITNRKL